jgi:hypothetical protein
MEGFYFTGWLTALIIGFIKMFIGFSNLNSIRSQNLEKVGLYFNFFIGDYTTTKPFFLVYILYVGYLLGLAPLFSWLSVISGSWTFISAWNNKVEPPEKIKELQFKIATMDLPKEDVQSILSELKSILGSDARLENSIEEQVFDKISPPENNTLNLGDEKWPADFEIDTNTKTIVYTGHTDDLSSHFYTYYQYKIEGNVVSMRVLEDSTTTGGKTERHIMDNVVLESDIRKSCEGYSVSDPTRLIVKVLI